MKSKLTQGIAYLKLLTLNKSINFIKIHLSFFLSILLKRDLLWGKPYSISIEPTTICNLHCPECPTGMQTLKRKSGNMDLQTYIRIIDELRRHLLFVNLYFQGEPFLNPLFFDFVNYAYQNKIYSGTSTNGHFLNKESSEKIIKSGLNRIIISMDGTNQESYSSYRKGGKLNLVIEGIKNLVEAKKTMKSLNPYIIIQFLVLKTNEHQIPEIIKLTKEIGVDELQLKSAQFYDYSEGNCLMPDNTKYLRYKKLNNGKWVIKKSLVNNCFKMWHSCVVTWNGDVVPCCFDKDADFKFGNFKETSFIKIWNNNKYKEFRNTIFKNRKSVNICRNCSE